MSRKSTATVEPASHDPTAIPGSPSRLGRGPWGVLWRVLRAADRFVRLHFIPFSSLLAILGATAVESSPSLGQWLGLLAGTLCFHNFAYVLNDVIDLPVDRTQPLRQDDYLVRGVIRPWQALAFALAQVPVAFAVTWALGGGREALGILGAGFGLMTVYNLWGKKCPVPPVTDLAQGLAWGSLTLWGAWVVGGPPTPLAWVAFAYGAGFILLINGVHGGLRDLENDRRSGRITTALFFGARDRAQAGPGLTIFALAVQGLLVAATLVPLARNDFAYGPAAWWTVAVLVGALDLACLRSMGLVLQPRTDAWQRHFRVHLFLLLFTLVALFAPSLEPVALAVFLLLFFCPLAFHDTTYAVLGGLARRLSVQDRAYERA